MSSVGNYLIDFELDRRFFCFLLRAFTQYMLLDILEIGELLPIIKPRVWFDLFKMLPFCFLFLLFRFCQQYISDCFSQRFLCNRLIYSHKSRNILCENFIHGWILNRWICFLKEELLLLTVCRF